MFEDFKKAFKVKKQKDYARRKAKVQAALEELWLAAEQLEALDKNGNDGAKIPCKEARFEHDRATKKLQETDKLVSRDPAAAYKQLEDIKEEVKAAAKAASEAREEKVYQDPKARLQLDMGEGWDGPAPKVHPAIIKGFDKLTKDEIETATKTVGAKIRNGKQLFDDLMLHPEEFLDKEPDLKQITDLMWFLRNKAEEVVGQPFEKGALSLPDSGNMLRGYLDKCQEVYNRFSSHMKAQQEKVGGSARAVDFYEGDIKSNPDALLPYGMNTMLVQSMKIEGTGEERLYVKLETESARLGAPTAGGALTGLIAEKRGNQKMEVDPQFQKSRKDVDSSTLPTSRPRMEEDLERTIEHGKNLVRKQKSRIKGLKRFAENEIGGSKETVEKELLPRYEAIIKAAQAAKASALVDALKKGNYKKEINEMITNLDKFMDLALESDLPDQQFMALYEALGGFEDYLREKGLDKGKESRVMSEVVLTPDALKPKGVTPDAMTADLKAALQDLKTRDSKETNVTKLQGLANGARRTLQRASNFMTAKPVKTAAQNLQAEVDKLSNEIALLQKMTPLAADRIIQAQLQGLRAITQRSLIADDPTFPTVAEAQGAYDKAVQAAYDIMQLTHLAKDDVLQTQVRALTKAADDFIAVIEMIEAANEQD